MTNSTANLSSTHAAEARGAVMPGVLAALAYVLPAGRNDWHWWAAHGDTQASHAANPIRFGPDTVAVKAEPKEGPPHPSKRTP